MSIHLYRNNRYNINAPNFVKPELPGKAQWIKGSTLMQKFNYRNKRSMELQKVDTKLEAFHLQMDAPSNMRSEAMILASLQDLCLAISEWKTSHTNKKGKIRGKRKRVVVELEQKAKKMYNSKIESAKSALKQQRQKWTSDSSGFTSPADHNPKKFQYLINGLTPRPSTPKHPVNRAAGNPSVIKKNPGIISASVINEKKNTVWAPSGYILSPPASNIHAANKSDMGILNQIEAEKKQEHLDLLAARNGLPPPKSILEKTLVNRHNEVAVTAGKNLKITGIYIIEGKERSKPQTGFRVATNANSLPITYKGKEVVVEEPAIPAEWMEKYEKVSKKEKIPIVWIKQSEGATHQLPEWLSKKPSSIQIKLEDIPPQDRKPIISQIHTKNP